MQAVRFRLGDEVVMLGFMSSTLRVGQADDERFEALARHSQAQLRHVVDRTSEASNMSGHLSGSSSRALRRGHSSLHLRHRRRFACAVDEPLKRHPEHLRDARSGSGLEVFASTRLDHADVALG